MDLGTVRALAASLTSQVLGVVATVTRPAPDDTPVVTTGIWYVAPLEEAQPFGVDFSRREPRRILAVPRRTFPQGLPRGTVILAPETTDGTVLTWTVDGVERIDPDFVRLVLVQAAA